MPTNSKDKEYKYFMLVCLLIKGTIVSLEITSTQEKESKIFHLYGLDKTFFSYQKLALTQHVYQKEKCFLGSRSNTLLFMYQAAVKKKKKHKVIQE